MSSLANNLKAFIFYSRFAPSFTAVGFSARKLAWDKEDYDLTGQVWLVTGAYGGIGSAVVTAALDAGADVIAVGRNHAKLAALADSAGEHAQRLHLKTVDLSLVTDTRRFVETLQESDTRIDVLVNNVGILRHEYSQTAEGFETTYATNLLNHFVLTEGVLANGVLTDEARVINVSSGGMYGVPRNTTMLNQAQAGYNGTAAYASHKRAQLALTDYWQHTHADRNLRFYTMHPGWVDTEGVQTSLPTFRATMQFVLRNGAQGADSILWLGATAPAPVVDQIWLDREPRTAHAFSMTRQTATTVDDVAQKLEQDYERIISKRDHGKPNNA